MPIQIKQTTPDEAITRLRQIHSEVQDKFHDQWDWMDAEHCVEVLQSTIDKQRGTISWVRKQPVMVSMDRDEILSLMQRIEYLESELARYKELYAITMDIASTLPRDRL